jgi:hypothetical protein
MDVFFVAQVQKMFEASNVPWHTRLTSTVDYVMSEDPDQLVTLV